MKRINIYLILLKLGEKSFFSFNQRDRNVQLTTCILRFVVTFNEKIFHYLTPGVKSLITLFINLVFQRSKIIGNKLFLGKKDRLYSSMCF